MRRNLALNAAIAACLAKKFSTESQPMTTTTTTPALADLDRLIERGTSIAGWIDKFGAKADAVDVLQLVALARRAAQLVEPVQDVLTIPTAIMDISADARQSDEYKRGHRDARHAAADLVLARADELKALATPSPQVAEGAELPPGVDAALFAWGRSIKTDDTDAKIAARKALIAAIRQTREEAIAASRRAAGGEAKALDNRYREGYSAGWNEGRADLATPAPASAGQAAPASADLAALDVLRAGLVKVNRKHDVEHLIHQVDALTKSYAARFVAEQPAEGAWQERGRRARSVAQSTAPVSTEQAGDAQGYRYPTAGEIQADVAMESTALAAAVSAMSDSLDDCPLKDSLKVYAAVELAFKYGEAKYVEEVFDEIRLIRSTNAK